MRFATHDGPGIRTTVFLKGCPLSCSWCHNPESQSFQPDRLYFEERCRHCGDCIPACPEHAIQDVDGAITTSAACVRCGTCTDFCEAQARQIAGRPVSTAEIIREIEKDLIFFEESGGGVTLSGGEPCAHPAFTLAVLRGCRDRGIHTVLETCGFANPETFLNLAAEAGMVLFDLKSLDPEMHKRHTGVALDPILRNLEALARTGRPLTVRIPVVPGVNDSAADIARFAAYLEKLPVREIELLRYHKIGVDKYRRLGLTYKLQDTLPPDPADLARFRDALARPGRRVTIGGGS